MTDRRILFVTRGLGGKVKDIGLATAGEMALSTAGNGAGTITFGRGPAGASAWFQAPGWPGGPPAAPSFEKIEDLRAVHEVIRRAQEVR